MQFGHKQKPYRNLSTLVPPESILAQDSWSKMYKGEWQSVLSDTRLHHGQRRPVHARLADGAGGRSASVRREHCRRIYRSNAVPDRVWLERLHDLPVEAAGEGADDVLPAGQRGGSHDFKFGFEDIYDSYHIGINGQSGPYALGCRTATPLSPPDRIRFIDTGLAGATTTTRLDGRGEPRLSTTLVYVQDRWSPNNRLTVTAGLRFDYQDVGYKDGIRKP